MALHKILFVLFLGAGCSARIPSSRETSVSWAYETGARLGNIFPFTGPDVEGGEEGTKTRAAEANCVDLISNDLEEEIGQGDKALRLSDQLLSTVSDQIRLEEVCGAYEEKIRALATCQANSNSVQREKWGTAVLVLLKLICVKHQRVIGRNSECLADMESAVHWNCVNACRQSATPAVGTNGTNSFSVSDESSSEGICRVGACAVRCVNAQVQECEDNSQAIRELYSDLAGAQMLYGVETSQQQYGGNADTLLKSKKLPVKCQQIIAKSVENSLLPPVETESSSTVAPVDVGADGAVKDDKPANVGGAEI